ncbi:MAG: histidine kinase, partial [Pseudanabaena sp. M165S2SP1A06QC]|nr:histidine kinase [Pseudanabaena sp. M165S2SP1A06QC]
AGDRKFLFTLIDNAYKNVKYMLANLGISVEQRRSLLQSVLWTIEQLNREISS